MRGDALPGCSCCCRLGCAACAWSLKLGLLGLLSWCWPVRSMAIWQRRLHAIDPAEQTQVEIKDDGWAKQLACAARREHAMP